MMVERPLYLVDASIVVRWYLNSPPHVDLARQVRDDYLANRIAVLAPENIRAEVGGAIHQAIVAGRFAPRTVRSVIAAFSTQEFQWLRQKTSTFPRLA